MTTNSDVPFGDFQINQSTPFYHSNKDNKKSYGPNPRLVFEPISGNKDEDSLTVADVAAQEKARTTPKLWKQ